MFDIVRIYLVILGDLLAGYLLHVLSTLIYFYLIFSPVYSSSRHSFHDSSFFNLNLIFNSLPSLTLTKLLLVLVCTLHFSFLDSRYSISLDFFFNLSCLVFLHSFGIFFLTSLYFPQFSFLNLFFSLISFRMPSWR